MPNLCDNEGHYMENVLDMFWRRVEEIKGQSGPFEPIRSPFHPLNSAFHPLRSAFHPLRSPFHPLNSTFNPRRGAAQFLVLQQLLEDYVNPYV
jgi:hypothetical protein